MKMTKEKILLLIMVAVVGGVVAMDGKYEPVSVPSTSAPEDIPPLPGEPREVAFHAWRDVEARDLEKSLSVTSLRESYE